MITIPENFQDLLRPEVKALAILATVMPDGTPQATPLWFSWDGQCILVNTAKGRTKERNMRMRPEVAVVILDPKIPTRYIQIRGKVIEATESDADAHINALSLKYDGKPWSKVAGQVRVLFRILPGHVNADQ